jgi:hypothetical protein
MENTEEKIDMLIQKLRSTSPELKDTGMLTENIMQNIKDRNRQKIPVLLIWIRTVSSSAAILLLGLFLFQQNEATTITSSDKQTSHFENKINIDSICLQNQLNSKANLMSIYICHLQQNSVKNKLYRTFDQQLKN